MLVAPGSAYEDDLTIPNEEKLYRIVKNNAIIWKNDRAVRVKSPAFSDQSKARTIELGYPAVAMSVFLESEMKKLGLGPADLLRDPQWSGPYGVVHITAGQARNEEQGVERRPLDNSPAHAVVFATQGNERTLRQRQQLAKESQIDILPPQP